MMLDLYAITSAEIGHMTERFTPFQESVTKIWLVRTKIFQYESQFCYVTTNEILRMNCVFFGLL